MPENVLLVADMNRIVLRGLGVSDPHSYTALSGSLYTTSYTALVYSAANRTVFYSNAYRSVPVYIVAAACSYSLSCTLWSC